MPDNKPAILGDMFNYFNSCGIMSAIVSLYYNNDFRENIENFYQDQTDEKLSKVFPAIADPRLTADWNDGDKKNILNKKRREIVIAIRNFWHAHIKGDKLCSPFGKIWAFNRLAEAFELPRRMYVPCTQYISGEKQVQDHLKALKSKCKDALKDTTYDEKKIEECNNLWKELKGLKKEFELWTIFFEQDNIVEPNKDTIISQILLNRVNNDTKIFKNTYGKQQIRPPSEVIQILASIGARFNLEQYKTTLEENEENGFANCHIDNVNKGHHEAFVTLDKNESYHYSLLRNDALEEHIEPEERHGERITDGDLKKSDGLLRGTFNPFRKKAVFMKLEDSLKPELNLRTEIETYNRRKERNITPTTQATGNERGAGQENTNDLVQQNTRLKEEKQEIENNLTIQKQQNNKLKEENNILRQKLQQKERDYENLKNIEKKNIEKKYQQELQNMHNSYKARLQELREKYQYLADRRSTKEGIQRDRAKQFYSNNNGMKVSPFSSYKNSQRNSLNKNSQRNKTNYITSNPFARFK